MAGGGNLRGPDELIIHCNLGEDRTLGLGGWHRVKIREEWRSDNPYFGHGFELGFVGKKETNATKNSRVARARHPDNMPYEHSRAGSFVRIPFSRIASYDTGNTDDNIRIHRESIMISLVRGRRTDKEYIYLRPCEQEHCSPITLDQLLRWLRYRYDAYRRGIENQERDASAARGRRVTNFVNDESRRQAAAMFARMPPPPGGAGAGGRGGGGGGGGRRRIARRVPIAIRVNTANGRGGGAGGRTGGRKKRKRKITKRKITRRKTTKRKSKARMTKQKRKVNGVTRNVRVSSTGRKYVLLKGRKHYL